MKRTYYPGTTSYVEEIQPEANEFKPTPHQRALLDGVRAMPPQAFPSHLVAPSLGQAQEAAHGSDH